MKDLIQDLPASLFVRCHGSFLVNLDYVVRIDGDQIFLPNATVPLSRTYKKEFMDAFTRFLGGTHGW